MSSTEASSSLSEAARRTLLEVARRSIEHGLLEHEPLQVIPEEFASELQRDGATFVTLHLHGALRGCVGTLEAQQPIVVDAARHAWGAAFEDPRFSPLNEEDFADIDIHVTILSPITELDFADEDDLAVQLRPGIDGLVLEDRGRRATFLPAVWETLQDPYVFISQLKLKAGLPLDYWSSTIKFHRYTSDSIPD